jgi:hypothetical protein
VRKLIACLVAAGAVAFAAPAADARNAAIYASAQGGWQTSGDTGLQLGFEAGARVFIFDGYVDYMGFGSGRSISRAILGVRGGLGTGALRLTLRGGAGAIRESSGALMTPVGPTTLTRTGGVLRGGAALELRLYKGAWIGAGVDGEAYTFWGGNTGHTTSGSNVLGVARLTIEFGL